MQSGTVLNANEGKVEVRRDPKTGPEVKIKDNAGQFYVALYHMSYQQLEDLRDECNALLQSLQVDEDEAPVDRWWSAALAEASS